MDINIVSFSNFVYDKIKLSEPINITSNRKKIFIGYEEEDNVHILSPYLNNNLIYTMPTKYQFIKINFDPFVGQIYNFYKLIENFEENIKAHINDTMPNYHFVSIIKSDQNDIFDDDDDDNECLNTSYIHLKLNLTETRDGKITKIYNSQSSECDITNLKNGWKYKCLIHFNYIWFDSDKKRCGLSLDLTQLKIYQPSYLSKCLIDNNQTLLNPTHISHIQHPMNLMMQSQSNHNFVPTLTTPNTIHNNLNNNVTNNINNNQTINNIKPIMVVPNAMELLNIKNALKKVV